MLGWAGWMVKYQDDICTVTSLTTNQAQYRQNIADMCSTIATTPNYYLPKAINHYKHTQLYNNYHNQPAIIIKNRLVTKMNYSCHTTDTRYKQHSFKSLPVCLQHITIFDWCFEHLTAQNCHLQFISLSNPSVGKTHHTMSFQSLKKQ